MTEHARSAAEQQLVEDRALRDAARAVFDARKSGVQRALAEKPIGTRLADEALGRAKAAAGDAAEIAGENRAVIAGTGLALAAWIFRKPLSRWGKSAVQRDQPGELATRWQRLHDWIDAKVKP